MSPIAGCAARSDIRVQTKIISDHYTLSPAWFTVAWNIHNGMARAMFQDCKVLSFRLLAVWLSLVSMFSCMFGGSSAFVRLAVWTRNKSIGGRLAPAETTSKHGAKDADVQLASLNLNDI